MIEASFGTFAPFNAAVRRIFAERIDPAPRLVALESLQVQVEVQMG